MATAAISEANKVSNVRKLATCTSLQSFVGWLNFGEPQRLTLVSFHLLTLSLSLSFSLSPSLSLFAGLRPYRYRQPRRLLAIATFSIVSAHRHVAQKSVT